MTLDLSLPAQPPRRGRKVLEVATLLLALTAVVLLIFVLFESAEPETGTPDGSTHLDRELAETLEQRTLWREAAALWEDLAVDGEDMFRAGKCRMLAGDPQRAVRNLLAAETAGLSEDLAAESSRLVLEAYATLGKFAVRNEALKRRTGSNEQEKAEIVARVGEDSITREELREAVRDEELERLMAIGHLDRDSLDRAVAARNADPKLLLPTLSRILSARALALQALKQGLGDNPALNRRLRTVRRGILANLLMEDRLLREVRASDADLEDAYRAHPDRYTEPEAARFSWGPNQDELTVIAGWHERGAPFPEALPRSAEADALLFALKTGETADRTVKIGNREVLIRLLEKRPARVIPFADARERVAADVFARKRNEAVQTIRQEVRADHPIEIVDEDLRDLYQQLRTKGK